VPSLFEPRTTAARVAACELGKSDRLHLGHNRSMARGWESKSVEDQQDAAAARRVKAGPAPDAAELEVRQKRASIELSRVRVLHDLEAATHPRRRQQLQAALKHLEKQLTALANPAGRQ
jgi:hypothetical protein